MDCVVCLQSEMDHKCPPSKWCQGMPHIRPYIEDMRYIAKEIHGGRSRSDPSLTTNVKEQVALVDVKLPEGGVVDDVVLTKAMKIIMRHVLRGKIVYMHGWAGYGRTGIMTALLLHEVYGLNARDALKYTQKFHDARGNLNTDGGKFRSPSTSQQRAQATRLCQLDTRNAKPKSASRPSRSGAQMQSLSRPKMGEGSSSPRHNDAHRAAARPGSAARRPRSGTSRDVVTTTTRISSPRVARISSPRTPTKPPQPRFGPGSAAAKTKRGGPKASPQSPRNAAKKPFDPNKRVNLGTPTKISAGHTPARGAPRKDSISSPLASRRAQRLAPVPTMK